MKIFDYTDHSDPRIDIELTKDDEDVILAIYEAASRSAQTMTKNMCWSAGKEACEVAGKLEVVMSKLGVYGGKE